MQSVPITTDVVSSNLDQGRCTTVCDKVCQWLATGQWFSQGPLVSSTNKTDHHDITEILLKVALNTIKQTNILSIDNQSKLRWHILKFKQSKASCNIMGNQHIKCQLKDVTSDQPDRETCTLKCHYLEWSGLGDTDNQQLIMVNISTLTWVRTLTWIYKHIKLDFKIFILKKLRL